MAKCDKTHLDNVERIARLIILAGKLRGFALASEMLEYYLSGKGGTKQIPLSQLKKSKRFEQAVKDLQKRLEWPLVEAVLAAVTTKFPNRQVNRVEGKNAISQAVVAEPESDLYYASNRSGISAEPKFSLMLQHGLPAISGHALFKWFDKYDWDRNSTKSLRIMGYEVVNFRDFDDLQACKRAKVFKMEAQWNARVQAKPGLKDLVRRILSQRRSQYEVKAMIEQDIKQGKLFQWSGF